MIDKGFFIFLIIFFFSFLKPVSLIFRAILLKKYLIYGTLSLHKFNMCVYILIGITTSKFKTNYNLIENVK